MLSYFMLKDLPHFAVFATCRLPWFAPSISLCMSLSLSRVLVLFLKTFYGLLVCSITYPTASENGCEVKGFVLQLPVTSGCDVYWLPLRLLEAGYDARRRLPPSLLFSRLRNCRPCGGLEGKDIRKVLGKWVDKPFLTNRMASAPYYASTAGFGGEGLSHRSGLWRSLPFWNPKGWFLWQSLTLVRRGKIPDNSGWTPKYGNIL